MRVAFTTTDGLKVDEHFGRASRYDVWEITADEAAFVERVAAVTTAADEDDRTAARAAALAGCAIVYVRQIGGPAAAKLVSRRIHPLRTQDDEPIADLTAALQRVLRGTPPPWLRKALAAGEPA